jgi:hypothetical protein
MKQLFDNTTKAGTASGTLLTIVGTISSQDILKTVVLAAIGSIVSFGITILLKSIIQRFKK